MALLGLKDLPQFVPVTIESFFGIPVFPGGFDVNDLKEAINASNTRRPLGQFLIDLLCREINQQGIEMIDADGNMIYMINFQKNGDTIFNADPSVKPKNVNIGGINILTFKNNINSRNQVLVNVILQHTAFIFGMVEIRVNENIIWDTLVWNGRLILSRLGISTDANNNIQLTYFPTCVDSETVSNDIVFVGKTKQDFEGDIRACIILHVVDRDIPLVIFSMKEVFRILVKDRNLD